MKRINTKQLLTILLEQSEKKQRNIGLQYFVNESGSRNINKKKALQKRVKGVFSINGDYAKSVERRTGESFIAEKPKGKHFLVKNCKNILVSDKDNSLLLRLFKFPKIQNTTFKSTTQYFHDGSEISFEKAKELNLFAPSFFKKKDYTSGRGTVSKDKDFKPFDISLKNIEFISIDSEKYQIEI